MLSLIIQKIN